MALEQVSILSGLLQGLIAGEQMQREQEKQAQETERQRLLMQLQVNEILSRQQMAEQQMAMEEEKLQMAKEAHEWQRTQSELLSKGAHYDLIVKRTQIIADRTLRGLSAGKSYEQIAQELSATLNEPVTPEEVAIHADRSVVYQAIDQMLQNMVITKADPNAIESIANQVRSRFGKLADDPAVRKYIQAQAQAKAFDYSQRLKAKGEEIKVTGEAEKPFLAFKAELERRNALASISAQGRETRRNIAYQMQIQQRMQQQQMEQMLKGASAFDIGSRQWDFSKADIGSPTPFNAEYNKGFSDLNKTATAWAKAQGIKTPPPFTTWKNYKHLKPLYYSMKLTFDGSFSLSALNALKGIADEPNFNFQLDSATKPLKDTLKSLAEEVRAGNLSYNQALEMLRQAGLYGERISYVGDDGRRYINVHTADVLFRIYIDKAYGQRYKWVELEKGKPFQPVQQRGGTPAGAQSTQYERTRGFAQ
jgi:hypothetical protein